MKSLAIVGATLLVLMSAVPAGADQRFLATLTGAQEVPSHTVAARGTGTVAFNASTNEIKVNLSFSGLTGNPIAAHIHGPAFAGTNAGVLIDLSATLPAATSGSITEQTITIAPAQATQLTGGELYFNIHTNANPGGEIRGQIMVAPAQKFVARLIGAEQVPPAASAGIGSGTVVLNAAEDQITVNMSFSGLSTNAFAAHIHGPAAAGANAGVLFNFTGVPAATSGSIPEQTFAITPTQVAQLRTALFYFNIHTTSFPDGEIRGQILLAPTKKFSGDLAAFQEVPPHAASGTGTGTVLLSAAENTIAVNLSFAGLTGNPIAAHIHGPAAPGANAGILFDLSAGLPAATSGSIAERVFTITGGQVAQLEAGQFYFNIHTSMFSGGEIRGQINVVPTTKLFTTLSGAQEVPPTASAATGSGTVLLNPTEDGITAALTFSGLGSNAAAAHIHGPAPPGANAGILFPIAGVLATTAELVPDQSFLITAAQTAALIGGQHYFNVHSTTLPDGEIRGQLARNPTLRVTKAGTATSNGTLTSSPSGIVCGGDCLEAYDTGTQVTLNAGAAGSGSFFAGWSGGGCSGIGACVVTLAADTTVTATFSPTSFTFTDDPLSTGVTVVKAVHISELRTAVNTLRANNSLAPFVFTDPSLSATTTPVRAIHITELRTALNAVYTQLKQPLPSYTDPALAAGQVVKGIHVAELRLAVRLIG